MKKCVLLFLCIALCFFIMPELAANAQSGNGLSGERISGDDRYKTSIEISREGWKSVCDTAVIATGTDFPDALCAAPLAKKYNAPILLTDPKKLSEDLLNELNRLKVKNIFIIGGTGVVSQSIEDKLVLEGMKCTRLSGTDRYQTSASVAAELGSSSTAVITTGTDFPDALSIASWAAFSQIPILLTDSGKLPDPVINYINENKVSNTYIIGGTGAVSDKVLSMLPGAVRIDGADRYSTNLAILKKLRSEYNLGKIYLATGEDFPDALSGSAMAALTNSPVILTSITSSASTKEFIDTNKDKLSEVYILGGDGVVPENAVTNIIPPMVTRIDVSVPSGQLGINKNVDVKTDITMLPVNSESPKPVYSVSNPEVASIDIDGTLTGLSPGTTQVTAAAGGKSSSLNIRVVLDKTIVLDAGHGGWSTGAVPVSITGEKLPQYKESVLNMQIVQKVQSGLSAIGANVILAREGDTYVSLEDRTKIANGAKADLFISIHHDSVVNPLSSGTGAYYSTYKPGVDLKDIYVVADGTSTVYAPDGTILGSLEDKKEYEFVKDEGGYIYILYNGIVGRTTLSHVVVHDRTPSDVSKKSAYLASSINQGIIDLGLPGHGVYDNNFEVNKLTTCASVLIEVGFLSNPYEFLKISKNSFQSDVSDKIIKSVLDLYKNEVPSSDDQETIPVTP